MTIFRLCWIVALTLIISGSMAAQEAPASEAEPAAITVYLSPAPRDIADAGARFVDELTSEIARAGMVVNTAETRTGADVTIDFRQPPEAETPEVHVDVLRDPLRGLSPLLDGGLQFSIDLHATDTLALITAALLYTAGQCDLALPYLASVQPDQLMIQAAIRGNCAIMDSDLETAAELLTGPAAQDDIWNALDRHLAWVYVQIDQAQAAIDLASAAVESAPDDGVRVAVLADRARLYALAFDYDSAIADADAAIALAPDDAGLYVLRGQMILLLYEWDRALLDFDTAIALDGAYADAYFYRGLLYYSVLEREAALADFERYLDLAPDGDLAEQAAAYAESIRVELDALSG